MKKLAWLLIAVFAIAVLGCTQGDDAAGGRKDPANDPLTKDE